MKVFRYSSVISTSCVLASIALAVASVVSGCAQTQSAQNAKLMNADVPSSFASETSDKDVSLASTSLKALQDFEAAPSSGYELGPGDVIDVTVWAHPELSGKHTIGPDGRIQIPFVGSPKIADMTADNAGEFITRAISENYVGPVATVQVDQYTDNQILVLGHVAQPGVLRFADQPTLLEALARANGTGGDTSLTKCAVFRGSDRMIRINLRPLLRGEDTVLNIRLRRNDVVYVPNPGDEQIYVMGQVGKPGAYPLTPDMSFLEALAKAGGPTDTAQPSQIVLVRPDQHLQQIIDLHDYLNGKTVKNYTLNRGDIVYVPKSGVAKLGWVLQQINPLTSALLFGAAIF